MKMKAYALLIVILMLTVFSSGCSAQGANTVVLEVGSKIMTVNGQTFELDTEPILQDDRTLLPLRAVVEGLGGSVAWEEETGTAVFAKGENVIFITIGSKTAFVNTEKHILDTVPIIIDGRTTPAVAATAPAMPRCLKPVKVAQFIAIGPGVDSAITVTSISSSSVIHPRFSTHSCSMTGSMA